MGVRRVANRDADTTVTARSRRIGLCALLSVAMLVVTACVGQASPAPSARATRSATNAPATRVPVLAPSPQDTPPPNIDLGCADLVVAKPERPADPTLAPAPQPSIPGADADAQAAIDHAVDQLAALGSYQFTSDISGRDVSALAPSLLDFGLRGTVDHSNGFAMDTLVGTRMREPNGSAAFSATDRAVVGGGYLWATDNVSGVLEPLSAQSAVEGIAALAPEGLAGRIVTPFAAGYRRVGSEQHGGVATEHFRRSAGGAKAYADALQFDGDVAGDLWIATDGGYLAAARISGKGSHRDASTGADVDDGFAIGFDITRPNDPANSVQLPVAPLPDPVRPSEPPVDLRLEYQVLPSNGTGPTAADLDAIGVTLRSRLDITRRPVKVDALEPDRITVTICDTTDPDGDRRLMTAHGALNVVPLPASTYGSVAEPGGTELPAVGGQIDPTLAPVAPAGRAGLTRSHVDPTTGRRGLAIDLANPATDAFMAYATAHPGEYVAVVLDGTVLATLPIEGQTAKGDFVFTGDYTEAEAQLLASWLYRDPITFELQPTGDIEVPTH